jgi:anti-anti-sigma regulatory factor
MAAGMWIDAHRWLDEASAVPRGAPVLSLPARCDRDAAASLLPDLLAALAERGAAVDGLGVRRVGLAMLQLLASARMTARAHGVPLAIVGSVALRDAAQAAGLDDVLFEGGCR